MTESERQGCEELLSHAGWVRALARHLTADAHTGDDLAQDAIAAALVRPPPNDRPLRSWLAGIVRNLVRQDRRSAGRRSARERAASRDEADMSSVQLTERLDTHRAVVEAVRKLDEPYRAVLLMRYFEGLSPAAIAAATGTPLRTVHTRLHRALTRLRAELDRAHGGDRNTWLLALVPFARGSKGWSAAAIGALVMDAKLKVALAAVAVVGICSTIALWPSDSPDAHSASTAAAPSAMERKAKAPRASDTSLESVPEVVDRRAQESKATVALTAPKIAVPAKLTGRVIDVDRAPVSGVKVRYFAPMVSHRTSGEGELETATDASGAFELADPHEGGYLDIVSAGWTSLFRPDLMHETATREITIVVARAVTLGGVVVDAAHQPIASASVTVPLPFGLRSRFDAILDSSSSVERGTKTDADGRFELKDVPLVPGTLLMTSSATHLPDERSVPAHEDLALEIVLESAKKDPKQLVGTVVDLEENPVEGAWVAFGDASTKSGPGGAFAFEVAPQSNDAAASSSDSRTDVRDSTPLRAVKRGYLPGETVRSSAGAWPEPLILHLGAPPLAIRGRVVDADDKPVARAEVWTDEETHFGYVEIEGGEMRMKAGASIEGVLRGDPWTRRTRTDANGEFELAGLLPHDYRVHALDQKRMLATKASFAAGVQNVEIRMPKEDLYEVVAGRVTSLSGGPIEGLEVALERKSDGAQGSEIDALAGFTVRTSADGRFAFENVSRGVNVVSVSGVDLGLVRLKHPIQPGDDVANLELAVPMRVHVQIDSREQSEFDGVALFDALGEKLYLSVYHGKSAYAMQDIPLQEGRTEPFSVSEAATTLVLYKQKVEVRRVPVKLVRGELNAIRP